MRIPVVDDQPLFGLFLRRALAPEGLEVIEAYSGKQALHAFDAHPYALALIDFHLGDMTGLQLTRSILKRDPETVILVMTAAAHPRERSKVLAAGAFDLIEKPFSSMNHVRAVVRRAVATARARRDVTGVAGS